MQAVQAVDDGGLDKDRNGQDLEKSLKSRDTLKVGLTGIMRDEGKNEGFNDDS